MQELTVFEKTAPRRAPSSGDEQTDQAAAFTLNRHACNNGSV